MKRTGLLKTEKRRRLLPLVLSLVMVLTVMGPAATNAYAVEGTQVKYNMTGYYSLYGRKSKVAMGYNGSNIVLQKLNDEDKKQIIRLKKKGKKSYMYSLQLAYNGKYICIDKNHGNAYLSNTPIYYKVFLKNSEFCFYSPDCEKVIDVDGGNWSAGTKIQPYKPNGTAAQYFALKRLYGVE